MQGGCSVTMSGGSVQGSHLARGVCYLFSLHFIKKILKKPAKQPVLAVWKICPVFWKDCPAHFEAHPPPLCQTKRQTTFNKKIPWKSKAKNPTPNSPSAYKSIRLSSLASIPSWSRADRKEWLWAPVALHFVPADCPPALISFFYHIDCYIFTFHLVGCFD